MEVCLCRAISGKLFVGQELIAASCRILAGISSGPVALFGFRPCNSLATPSVVIMMSDIGGMFMLGS